MYNIDLTDVRINGKKTVIFCASMLVDNYSVFYIVGEDTVSVARVLYSASDLVRRLRRMK